MSPPERLMSEVKFMEKHPEVGVVGSAVEWIDATGKSLPTSTLPPRVTLDRALEHCEIQSTPVKSCVF